MRNVLTVDLEEYFHPTEVHLVDPAAWTSFPSRVEEQTATLLELLDESDVRATFFVLGWVADHHSRLIRRIYEAGHEIGCHSYFHRLVYDLTPTEFEADTLRAVRAIEDACGFSPRIYRAPSYSITARSLWALEVLAGLGFTHDSSIYPIAHDRYGIPGFYRHAHTVHTCSGPIREVPIATVTLGSHVAPVGGGGYLRLLPYSYTAAGIRRVNDSERQPACVYFHPWELDVAQPRLATGWISRTRTYWGLAAMPRKIARLLAEFQFSTITAVHPEVSAEPSFQRLEDGYYLPLADSGAHVAAT